MKATLFLLSLFVGGGAAAQTTTFSSAGQYYMLNEGPTSHNARIFTIYRDGLHYYPNVDLSQNYSSQNLDPFDERIAVNLTKDYYADFVNYNTRVIGLPKSVTAVKLHIKIKAQIRQATWDGLGDPPAQSYAQCDLIPAKLSALPLDKSDLAGFAQFAANYNHAAQAETNYFVPWDQENRVIRFAEVTVPVSYNEQGEPCIGFIFNWAIMNRTATGAPTSTEGVSRGFVEATVYLEGYFMNKATPTLDGPKTKSG